MLSIFISYRRQDVPQASESIHARLHTEFPLTFIDREGISPAEHFPMRIRDAIRGSDVMLVVIGPRWLSLLGDDTCSDYVQAEIQTALEEGLYLLPVLVEGAAMPEADQLPAAIRPLHAFNALDWQGPADSERLCALLYERVARLPDQVRPGGPRSQAAEPEPGPAWYPDAGHELAPAGADRTASAAARTTQRESLRGLRLDADTTSRRLFEAVDLRHCSFRGDWSDARFIDCQLEGTDFRDAVLRHAALHGCSLGIAPRAALLLGIGLLAMQMLTAACAVLALFMAVVAMQKLMTNLVALAAGGPLPGLPWHLWLIDDLTFLVYGTLHAMLGGILIAIPLWRYTNPARWRRAPPPGLALLVVLGTIGYLIGSTDLLGVSAVTATPCDVESVTLADSVRYLGMSAVYLPVGLLSACGLGVLTRAASRTGWRVATGPGADAFRLLGLLFAAALIFSIGALQEPLARFQGQVCQLAVLGTIGVTALLSLRTRGFAMAVHARLQAGHAPGLDRLILLALSPYASQFQGTDLEHASLEGCRVMLADLRDTRLL
ncbi:MAG: TIR domain-containing protein, partial [Gammaproteobacteria bacterium]|nr:TIR domain-containing protein [Gammaproteobacteria bacterium]